MGSQRPLVERYDELRGECNALRAEIERHRSANLLRAVIDGYGPLDEFVTAAINAEDFDRVPWLVAEGSVSHKKRLLAFIDRLDISIAHPDMGGNHQCKVGVDRQKLTPDEWAIVQEARST